MEVKTYIDAKKYIDDAKKLLEGHAIQNSLMLGNITVVEKSGIRDIDFFATVKNGDEIKIIANLTPPFNLIVYFVDNKI